MKRMFCGLLLAVALVLPSSAKASPETDAALLAQLKMLNESMQSLTGRIDKIEKAQGAAAVGQVRTALNRVPQPNNSASLNQALSTTQGQCASGRCGQSR
jgi:hypothetical protein